MLSQLTGRTRFSMVAYNSTTYIWSWNAKAATSSNRASATAWMEGLPAIESHCLLEAGLATISIANSTPAGRKRMIFLGNRPPFCWEGGFPFGSGYPEQCLSEITGANTDNIPIDTIFYPEFPGMGEEAFWIELATNNEGTFQLAPL